MRSTQQFSITLPRDMAAWVDAKVASGEYASRSDVIRAGLEALMDRDRAVEAWLREEVIPAAIECEQDPSRRLTPDQVREALAEAHRRRLRGDKRECYAPSKKDR